MSVILKKERFHGRDPRSKEWYEFETTIMVAEQGKQPVTMLVRPLGHHPFIEFPAVRKIKADSLTGGFIKIVNFLKSYGLEWRV